jgi:hypothetical protein
VITSRRQLPPQPLPQALPLLLRLHVPGHQVLACCKGGRVPEDVASYWPSPLQWWLLRACEPPSDMVGKRSDC